MKKITLLALVCSVAFLSGCNSTSDKKSKQMAELAKVENDDNYICKTVKKTGSNFKTRRCMTKEAYEKTRQEARDALNSLDRNWGVHSGG